MHDVGYEMPAPTLVGEKTEKSEKHYPRLCLEGKDLPTLPESGEMEIKFRVAHISEDKKSDTKRYELEVLAIGEVAGEEVEEERDDRSDAEAAIDALLLKASKSEE